MAKIEFDMHELAKQIKDQATIEALAIMVPDRDTGKRLKEFLGVFLKHGVSPDTAMAILTDYAELDDFIKDKE